MASLRTTARQIRSKVACLWWSARYAVRWTEHISPASTRCGQAAVAGFRF